MTEMEVSFNFGAKVSSFLSLVEQDTNKKDETFWESNLVTKINGKEPTYLRPAYNDLVDRHVYFFKRPNGSYDPSYVELDREFYVQFKDWVSGILEGIDNNVDGPTGILADHLDIASPQRVRRNFPSDFFVGPLAIQLGKFNARVVYDTIKRTTLFYVNNSKRSEEHKDWLGPQIMLSQGQIKKVLSALEFYEGKFQE